MGGASSSIPIRIPPRLDKKLGASQLAHEVRAALTRFEDWIGEPRLELYLFLDPPANPDAPDHPHSPRTPLQTAVNVITVVVALYSRLHLVLPYLLAWVFWGLMQRSARADRRWVAWAFAIPAAHLVGMMLSFLFLWRTLGLPETLIVGAPILWLYLRPSKAALWAQVVLSSVLLILLVSSLVEAFSGPSGSDLVRRVLVAEAYFHLGALGAAGLALFRDRPEVAPAQAALAPGEATSSR